MHIEITQSTGQSEQLPVEIGSNIVNKLYELALNDIIDSTSTISGRISLYAASKSKVEYLAGTNGVGGNGKFPNFIINCSTYYFDFLDLEMQRICSTLYGDGYGVTLAELLAVNRLNELSTALTNNTDIRILDLRGFPVLNYTGTRWFAIGLTSLSEVYIKQCKSFNLSIFNGGGSNPSGTILSNGRSFLRKIIINTLGDGKTRQVLNGSTDNNVEVEILAVKQIVYNTTGSAETLLGDYLFRRVHIDHFYIGEAVPPTLSMGYADNINNAINIYVPIGSSSAYAAANNWSEHTAGFLEYDFDTDPDGIFTLVN